MIDLKAAITVSAVLFAAACAHNDKPVSNEEGAQMSDSCSVLDSRNWQAWIDKMPGVGGGMRLHIAGEVDVPTPGYVFEWAEGPADRAQPPGLRFRLTATPPDGIVNQVVTTEQVKYVGETPYPAIRAIYVGCGDKKLGEITEIPIVQ